MTAAQAVIKGEELLVPHSIGCGAEVIHPDDPRYEALLATARRDEDLNGTPEQDAALAARWATRWGQDRLSA